jgi:hypothetical protein
VGGSDTNPCDSPLRPCRNIQSAITKVQAGGEVVVITSGSYRPFNINKSVTVVGAPGIHAGITVLPGQGVVINAGTSDVVVLRGLVLNGLGAIHGIGYQTGASLQVENCLIQGFAGNGIRFDNADNGQQLLVRDTVVRNIGISGIFVGLTSSGTARATIERCRLENNKEGLFVTDNAKVTIRDTVVWGSKAEGILAYTFNAGATAEINVENCLVTNGATSGIQADGVAGASLIRVSNTTVSNNHGGVNAISPIGTILSRGNNTVEGNSSDGAFTGTFAPK